MKLFIVIGLLSLLPLCYGLTASNEEKQCTERWVLTNPRGKDVLQRACYQIKSTIYCSSRETSDTSPVLDDWRIIIEQEAIFLNKFQACNPKIYVSKLTELLAATKAKYSSNILDNDHPEHCALKEYKTCAEKYYGVFDTKPSCALPIWISCLKEATKTCKADIMKHLAKIDEIFGKQIVKDMKKEKPENCDVSQ